MELSTEVLLTVMCPSNRRTRVHVLGQADLITVSNRPVHLVARTELGLLGRAVARGVCVS